MKPEKSEILPSGGKVIVVGIEPYRQDRFRYEGRLFVMSHWELGGDKKLDSGITAIIMSNRVADHNRARIENFARQRSVGFERIGHDQSELQKCLAKHLNHSGARPDEEAIAEATALLHRPRLTVDASGLEVDQTTGSILIPTERIRPFKDQPRTYFSPGKLAELEASIATIGQLTPIIVRPLSGDPDYDYELIEGERRLRVCRTLGIKKMKAVIQSVVNGEDQFICSFAVNFARDGHTPLDTARAINRILSFEMVQKMKAEDRMAWIGRLAGKSPFWVYQHHRLLTLPGEVQAMLEPDSKEETPLPAAMGHFLCSVQDSRIQLSVARAAAGGRMSVAKAKNMARNLAMKAGVSVTATRQRGPNKDYVILKTFLGNTVANARNLLDMPHRTIGELFQQRVYQDRRQAIQQIDEAIKLLGKIRDAVQLKAAK